MVVIVLLGKVCLHRYCLKLFFLFALLVIALPVLSAEYRLSSINIVTDDVFDKAQADDSWVANFLNTINWTTKHAVIERQLWMQVNDVVSDEDAQELERKLRAMDIFADVKVRLLPSPNNEDGAILDIQTRDRTSITFGSSGSFVGGVGTVGFTASERSLFGNGDIITLGYTENTTGDNRLAFSYEDIHFINNTTRASVRFGETEDGDFSGIAITSPFQHLGDNFSWDIGLEQEDRATDFLLNGNVVASVPFLKQSQVFTSTWRSGPKLQRWRNGIVLRNDTTDYFAATGELASDVDVPNDFTRIFAGVLIGYDNTDYFRKVIGLDTVVFPQDIRIGYNHELLLGIGRREQGLESDQTEIFYKTQAALQLGEHNYVSAELDTFARLRNKTSMQRRVRFTLSAYALGLKQQTLASRLSYDNNFIRDGLPIESRLGESDGLRGYENDSFSGVKRLRFNLEDRIFTNMQVATFSVGLLAFFDAGWVADKGDDFGSPYRSVGVGLRLGSKQLLGRNLLRIDLSFPLDNPDSDSPLLSISTGQLFSF